LKYVSGSSDQVQIWMLLNVCYGAVSYLLHSKHLQFDVFKHK